MLCRVGWLLGGKGQAVVFRRTLLLQLAPVLRGDPHHRCALGCSARLPLEHLKLQQQFPVFLPCSGRSEDWWRLIRDRVLSRVKESSSSRELDHLCHGVSAVGWGPAAVCPWAGGASQLRTDSAKRPVAVRRLIRQLQRLELVHAHFTASMQSNSGAAECVPQLYGDGAFPEFRRLGGDKSHLYRWSF